MHAANIAARNCNFIAIAFSRSIRVQYIALLRCSHNAMRTAARRSINIHDHLLATRGLVAGSTLAQAGAFNHDDRAGRSAT
jgi:hypothetical protein